MRRKWPLAVGIAVLVLIAAAAYGWYRNQQQRAARAEAERVARIEAQIPTQITVAGKIQARNVVNVAAPIDGTIDEYLVNAGEQVFEGEVLARIKNADLDAARTNAQAEAEKAQQRVTDLQAQLIRARLDATRARSDAVRAKAELDRAEAVYRRQKMLLDAGATPRLTYERAQQDYESAKKVYDGSGGLQQTADDRVAELSRDLDAAQSAVDTTNKDAENAVTQAAGAEVRSPVNGVVVARRGNAGDAVNPSMTDLIAIAVDLSSLEVVVALDPKIALRIRQGQTATIEIAEAPSEIQGTVREIKAGEIFVDFTSPSPVIKPGLTAVVKFTLG